MGKTVFFCERGGETKNGGGRVAVHGGRGGNPGSWAWNDQAVMN